MPDGRSLLEGQISDYERQIGQYDKSIREKALEADNYRANSLEDTPTSLQDALISAAIQITPGLLGYLAAGKQGAATGLQGGLAGGQIYNNIIDERQKNEAQRYGLQAQQADQERSRLQSLRDRLETRGDSLKNNLLMTDYREDLRRSRPNSGLGDAINNQTTLMQQLLARKEDDDTIPVDLIEESSTPETQAAPTSDEIDNARKIIDAYKKSGAGLEDLLTNTKQAKSVLDAVNKIRNYESGQLSDKQTEQGIEANQAELNDARRPLDTGAGYVLPPESGFSKQNAAKAQEMATRYRQVMNDITDIVKIANATDLPTRITDDKILGDLQRKRQSIVNKLQSLMSLTQENPSKADAAVQRILQAVPALGDVSSEIGTWLKSFTFTPTLQTQLDALQNDLSGDISTQFENYGGKFVPYDSIERRTDPNIPGSEFIKIKGTNRYIQVK